MYDEAEEEFATIFSEAMIKAAGFAGEDGIM